MVTITGTSLGSNYRARISEVDGTFRVKGRAEFVAWESGGSSSARTIVFPERKYTGVVRIAVCRSTGDYAECTPVDETSPYADMYTLVADERVASLSPSLGTSSGGTVVTVRTSWHSSCSRSGLS